MAHASFEHVGHGLEAAVRVRREAGDIVVRVLGIELVEHRERIEAFRGRAADHAGQADAGAIGGRVAGMQFEDITVAVMGTSWFVYGSMIVLSGRYMVASFM